MTSNVGFDAFREAWLASVRANSPSTTELGHRFATKLLTQWRDIDDSSDDLVYCDGAGDGGIDIAYLQRGEGIDGDNDSTEGDIWFLVQGKYGRAFQGSVTLLQEAQKVIDTLDGQRQRLSSLAEGLLERLTYFRSQASSQDRIVLVFATETPLSDEQKRVLEDVRNMGRGRLGTIFDVDAVSIETIYLRSLEDLTNQPQIEVSLRAELTQSGGELLVGSTSLFNLYAFMKGYRDRTGDLDQLYEKNVRRFLGARGKVNRAMQQTLQQTPERFGLYNNGITIVVSDFVREADGGLCLVEPYVVNGCQTTKAIWEVCYRRLEAGGTGKSEATDQWHERAMEGAVVTKIVKVGQRGEALLSDITRYTNSQNAVREKDFLTLATDFRSWAREMAEQYGIFLEVQRGGWDSQRAFQRQNPASMPRFTEFANAFDLLKVYGAGWQGEAGLAFGKNGPFLPNGTVFKRIVNDDTREQPFGADDLYAAYKLQQAADTYQFGRGAQERSRRQTRFLFYQVVLDLLRDVIVRNNISADPTTDILTQALIAIFADENSAAVDQLLETAVNIVDEYLTQGTEDSVFAEPTFINTYNSDLNSFLKWEQLGKSESTTPRYRQLLAAYKRTMGRATGGQPSPRDTVSTTIRRAFDREEGLGKDSAIMIATETTVEGMPGGFRNGSRVRHPQFGIGTVVSSKRLDDGDEEVTVKFEQGRRKTLRANFARLQQM